MELLRAGSGGAMHPEPGRAARARRVCEVPSLPAYLGSEGVRERCEADPKIRGLLEAGFSTATADQLKPCLPTPISTRLHRVLNCLLRSPLRQARLRCITPSNHWRVGRAHIRVQVHQLR